jgi:Spy/CpxP family protein refolding chaperone
VFLVAVVGTALIAATAIAQDKGKRGFRVGGGGFGGAATSPVTLASDESVQKELGVSGDKASKLTSLRDDLNAARTKEYQTAGVNLQDFQSITNEQRQKMTEIGRKLNDEFAPKVKELLTADQFKRLQQIQLQANLAFQGPPALNAPEVDSQLKLTEDQKQKLIAINTEFQQKQRDLFTGGGGRGGGEAFTKLRDERTAKTIDVLTPEQKEKLNALKGSAFDVSQIRMGGFGGRRGKGN